VPDTGLSVSHAVFSLAVQDKVPPPLLEMVTGFGAGVVPPTDAVKVRLVGLSPIAGVVGAVTVRATGTVFVVASGAVTVMAVL
jgi:hypothetical protein